MARNTMKDARSMQPDVRENHQPRPWPPEAGLLSLAYRDPLRCPVAVVERAVDAFLLR